MRRPYLIAPLALALAATACQDLAVTNPNEPDRGRAIQQPLSAEAFVSSAFRTWWPSVHDDYPAWAFALLGDEVSSNFADFGQLEISAIPRPSWNNSAVSNHADVNADPWFELYSTISSVNDALISIDSGLVIVSEPRTRRTEAMAKFIQGISHGYLGLYFDQGVVLDETVAVSQDMALDPGSAPQFRPYSEVIDSAVAQLDVAIAIAEANPFTIEADQWLFTEMSSADVVRLANSFAARLIAYSPRTRAERDAVDWNEVIRRVDAGVQQDFAPIAQPDILFDDWKRLLARQRSGPPSDFGRPSPMLYGPADSSEAFRTWLATPLENRVPFQINTRDRRIQGATGPESPGKYISYNRANIGTASRGTWRRSWYYFHRFGTGNSWQEGPQLALSVTEMDLLKAEALIRLGRAAEAVPLINKSRVANGELPPVTVDGPPDEPGCVPRKQDGTCGSLWDALRYEKRIEMIGVDPMVAYFDSRGWQTMVEGTIVHLPVPGRELDARRLPLYTFGGPGAEGSAPAADPERCPVALARCP